MPFVDGEVIGGGSASGRRGSRWATTAAIWAATVGMMVALVGTLAVAAPLSASAASTSSCSFANPGSGTYARTLCWFDMSTYSAAAAGSASGQSMTVALPGGYSISFTLNVSGGAVGPTAFPTYGGAYLGNGAYTDVAGKPALYQTGNGTTTTASLSAIRVVDSQGNPVTGYSFVGADAESTDTGESIAWTSNQPLSLISNIGNACNSGASLTGVGTTTVKCSATVSSTKTGTAILAAPAPTSFSQNMVGAGKQAVAFGVLVSSVQLSKTVASRVNPSDAFAVNISSSSGSVLGSANTGTATSASTGPLTVLTSSTGESFTLSESATSGLLSDYTPSWACTRNGAASASLPSGSAGTSASVTLGIGDFVNCTITNAAQSASLALVKHAGTPADVNHDGITDAGDTVAYTFMVTNTGALPMNNIAVSDPKAGPVSCPQATLASGQSETCRAQNLYTVTVADDTAGTVSNTATASGTPTGGVAPIQSPPSSTSTPTQTPAPAVSVVKTAKASSGDTQPVQVGETIGYSYLVTNTGNDNLSTVSVSDPTLGAVTCPTPPAPGLVPGASETCTADQTYTVTQADVDAGQVTDTATATGTDTAGRTSPASAPSTATPTTPAAPTVTMTKIGDASTGDTNSLRVGETIAYSYLVTNTGNVDLTSVAVDDPSLGSVTCPTPVNPGLPPGGSETCTADETHTVTQADVDAGQVTDTATASGIDTAGAASPTSAPSTDLIPQPAQPVVAIDKTATVAPSADQAAAKVGDSISYTYLVTNTGNVDLTSLAVDDPSLGAVTCPSPASPGLAPGASETCTADETHTVTQADVDADHITDTATATGIDTAGATSPASAPATASVQTAAPHPAVSMVKMADASTADTTSLTEGETIAYSYLVTNTGDVTLRSVAVVTTPVWVRSPVPPRPSPV